MRTLYRLFLHWEVLGEGVGQVSLRSFFFFFFFGWRLDSLCPPACFLEERKPVTT